MKENIVQKLTSKDDKYACAFTDRIVAESHDTDEWYEYFEDVASLLDHPKSLVRNRALYILAANAQWDEENRFDLILPDYLKHITDEKPITARQCVKALAQVGLARPQYIPQILSALRSADLSKYKDSMRPLIERDMEETEKILMNSSFSRSSEAQMKQISNKEYEKYQQYQTDKLHGRILTPDGLRVICAGLDNDPEKIGIHMLEMLAKFRNEGIVE